MYNDSRQPVVETVSEHRPPPPVSDSFSKFANSALAAVGIGVGAAILFAVFSGTFGVNLLPLGFGIATICGVYAVVQGARSLSNAGPRRRSFRAVGLVTVVGIAGGSLMAVFGALLTLVSTVGFARGRQLRKRGKILLPPVVEGGEWSGLPGKEIERSEDARAVADQWRENARTEHSSVAAFARLTLDLVGLGAPPSLVKDAQQDALDEIRHTELCFSLARALDGREEGPGAFPEARIVPRPFRARPLALAELAVTSLVDGALHEGLSAAVIAQLAKRCAAGPVRETLQEIAADEGRHAAHGWRVVEWCLEQGGEAVAHALRGAAFAIPQSVHTRRPAAARAGEWERFGIHGDALETQEYARMREHVTRRVAGMLAKRTRRWAGSLPTSTTISST